MGEAKLRRKGEQYSRAAFLAEHTRCCYCGKLATTTDHCPPRAMFRNRQWPEGYEFPACDPCNQEGRSYEPLLAMLRPLWVSKSQTRQEADQWERLAQGVANNQPELIREMFAHSSRNEQRKSFRKRFGDDLGDEFRRQGYGIASIGPLAQEAIRLFAIKLGKALFYKHTGTILDGEIWAYHFGSDRAEDTKQLLSIMTKITPLSSVLTRSGQSIDGQFIYRYNVSANPAPLLYAVIQFNDQLMFNVIAADHSFREIAGGSMGALDEFPFSQWHANARLDTASPRENNS